MHADDPDRINFTKPANIKQWMNCDPVLSRVRNMIQQGWQFAIDADFKLYEGKCKLRIHDGCILRGSQVVVPPSD